MTMMITPSTPGATVADAAVRVEGLCCPTDREPLELDADQLVCPRCGLIGRMLGPVASLMAHADPFYEGKYANRTKFVPRNDGYLATLPLRIVLFGYPNEVAAALPARSKVVEIGCAGGIDWFGHRYHMIGFDLSGASLRIAATNYDQVVQCDATRMPLADQSVDGVISSCLFEHLTAGDKERLLTECFRVLRPGGKVVFFYDITTENPIIAHYRHQRPDLYQTLFLDGDGHIGYAGPNENRAHFVGAGLSVEREIFHERTPVLASPVWHKLSQWPGFRGRAAKVMQRLGTGPMRQPWLGLIWVVDGTVGRLFPPRYARGMTTVAVKP